MKTISLIFVSLVLIMNCNAQKVQKRFNYAYNLYTEKKYDSALYIFTDIYNKGVGNQEVVYDSYYFAGLIYLKTKNVNAAKNVYTDILSTDFPSNDFEYNVWNNPFLQFKNNSCKILAEIALEAKDYKLALRYIKMAEEEYPFVHFCGNAHATNEIYLARMYAKCYDGMGEKAKAIQTLLPYCFSNGYASTTESASELAALIKDKYSKDEIKKEVANARTGLYMLEKEYDPLFPNFYVNLFNEKIQVTLSYKIQKKMKEADYRSIEAYQRSFDQEEFIKKILSD